MIMNDEDKIEQFSEPPKIVKVKDVRVCIMEREIAGQNYHSFLFAYPYRYEDGGVVKVFNPFYKPPKHYGEVGCNNKLIMWQAYMKVRNYGLNKGLKLLYEGPILGEDGYESKRFK